MIRFIIISLLASLASAADPSEFIIGCWQQPASKFADWKARGVHHVFTDAPKPANAGRADYFNDAHRAGLKLWISPAGFLATDDAHPAFAGPMQRDEPENWGARIKNPDGTWDMPATTARYLQQYRSAKSVAPGRTVFGNFNGMQLTGTRDGPRKPDGDIIKSDYVEFFKGADWLGGDWYVINTGRDAAKIPLLVGGMVDRLREWSDGRPVLAFIESSHQRLPNVPAGRAPTPGEMRATAWCAVIHGAKGIVYFPLRLGGSFQFDATPPELVKEMTRLNAELTACSDFIIRGQRTRGEGESAKWTLPDGSTLTVALTMEGGEWKTTVARPAPTWQPPETIRVTFPQGSFDYRVAR